MRYNQDVAIGCPQCGVSVFVHENKLYVPVRGYLLTGQLIGQDRTGGVAFRRAYVDHQCRVEDLDAYSRASESVVTALEKLIEDNPPQWLGDDLIDASKTAHTTREKLREVTERKSLTRGCPKCGVSAGDPCENLAERKRGNHALTKNPHSERLPQIDTVEGSELKLAREEAAEAHGLLYRIQDALKADNALEKLLHLAQRI